MMRLIAVALLFAGFTPQALAYIGPGAGMTLLGSIFGFLAAIVLGLLAVLAWPLRRMLKRRKARREAEQSGEEAQASEAAPKDAG